MDQKPIACPPEISQSLPDTPRSLQPHSYYAESVLPVAGEESHHRWSRLHSRRTVPTHRKCSCVQQKEHARPSAAPASNHALPARPHYSIEQLHLCFVQLPPNPKPRAEMEVDALPRRIFVLDTCSSCGNKTGIV